MTRRLVLLLGAIVVALTLWFGGPRGLLYLALYLLALAPGLPAGWRLFGKAPAGWVAGAVIGYGLTALALWVPIRLGVPHPIAFVIAWLVACGIVWRACRRPGAPPLIELPAWSSRETRAWLLVLFLVPVFLALPFGHLGREESSGVRDYRAYFIADFVWHTALTEEIAKFSEPPRNPYFADEPLHYYVTYFLVPAVLSGPADAPIVDMQTALKITAMGTALLFISLVFFAAWSAVGRAGPAAAATALAVVAPSFEGLFVIVQNLRRGVAPLAGVRDLNIDAITQWHFHGLRIDGLVRTMWYTPQHGTSLALGLVAVLAATRFGRIRPATPLLIGVALGLSVATNPVLGAVFCAVYGVVAVYDVIVRRQGVATLLTHGLSVLPVGAALVWCLANQMADRAASALTFGWFLYDSRHAPLVTLFLSLGGVLLPAVAGLLPWRRLPFRAAMPAVPMVVFALALMWGVTITDRAWIGFRAGNLLQVALPLLVARGLAGLAEAGGLRVAASAFGALLLAGAPTTLIDTYNAQDTTNVAMMGADFHWTVRLSPEQQTALAWIRTHTPPDAIVQADPLPRGEENWSLIPSFAARRMAAASALPLIMSPAEQAREKWVHTIIASLPPDQAHEAARALHIDYIWIDNDDLKMAPKADLERFGTAPDLFTLALRVGPVSIYRVR